MSKKMSADIDNVIHVRKFRWTFGSKNLPEQFMKDIKFDFINKTISFSYYDVVNSKTSGMHALIWAENPDDLMVFKTLDGCGNTLYEFHISGISVEEHTSDFDYGSNEVSTTQLTIKYKKVTKKFVAFSEKTTKQWLLCIEGKEYEVYLKNRPSLTVEETEVAFLNQKSWIPGKATWDSLFIDMDSSIIQPLVDKKFNFDLKLIERNDVLETWSVSNAYVVSFNNKKVELKFNEVKYQC